MATLTRDQATQAADWIADWLSDLVNFDETLLATMRALYDLAEKNDPITLEDE